jgi:hypothetical protein
VNDSSIIPAMRRCDRKEVSNLRKMGKAKKSILHGFTYQLRE